MELKGLAHPLLEVWREAATTSTIDGRVIQALQALCEIRNILDDHKHDAFFSNDAAASFVKHTDSFLTHYSWLAVKSDDRGTTAFSGAPKSH